MGIALHHLPDQAARMIALVWAPLGALAFVAFWVFCEWMGSRA